MAWLIALTLHTALVSAEVPADTEAAVPWDEDATAALALPPLRGAVDLVGFSGLRAARLRAGDDVWVALVIDGGASRLALVPRAAGCLPTDLEVDAYVVAAGAAPTVLVFGDEPWVAVWSHAQRCWAGDRLVPPRVTEGEAIDASGPKTGTTTLTIPGVEVGPLTATESGLAWGRARVTSIESKVTSQRGSRTVSARRTADGAVVANVNEHVDGGPELTRYLTVVLDPHDPAPLRHDELLVQVQPGVFEVRQAAFAQRLSLAGGSLVSERSWLQQRGMIDGPSRAANKRWSWSWVSASGRAHALGPDEDAAVGVAELEVDGGRTGRKRVVLADGHTLDVALSARAVTLQVKGGKRLVLSSPLPRFQRAHSWVVVSQAKTCADGPC